MRKPVKSTRLVHASFVFYSKEINQFRCSVSQQQWAPLPIFVLPLAVFVFFFFYFEKSKAKKLKPFLIEKWSIFDCYVDYINNGSSETAQTTEFRNRMHLIFTESENRKVNIIVSLFSIVVCRSRRRAFRRKRYFC